MVRRDYSDGALHVRVELSEEGDEDSRHSALLTHFIPEPYVS